MKPTTARFRLTVLLAALSMGAATGAFAALTDISQSPLASASSNLVKPNISYVLDTSGSMAWSHAPDESQPWFDNVGYKTSQCNSIYYNPNIVYPPARTYDGTAMANSSFTAAPKDGFSAYDNTSSSTVNLSTSFYAYDNTSSFGAGTDTLQPAYYYVYTGSQQATGLNYQNSNSTFYKECNAAEPKNGPTATITFSGSSLTIVDQISVNGVNIMSGATASTTSPTTLASTTAAKITLNGFSATSSSGKVTITGPASAQVAGVTPVITATPPFQFATVTFSGTKNTAVSSIKVNGTEIMTGTAGPATSSSTLATAVASAVGLNGYSATASGSVVTLQGPNPGASGSAVVTMVGNQSATLTFSGSGNTAVTQVKVGASNIMSSATALVSTSSLVAAAVAPKITLGGFAATASGSTVTITGGPLSTGLTPVATLIGPQTATVSFSGTGNTVVSGITVNGTSIMGGPSSAAANCTSVAANVAAAITGVGYTVAFSSGCTVTIPGPASANGFTPVVTTAPGNSTGSITFSGASSTSVSQIKVNGVSLMSSGTTASSACASVAFAVAAKITLGGYSATASSCTVNINGPASGIGFTPVITKSGSMAAATAALTGPTLISSSATAFTGASAMTSSGTAFADGGVGTMSVAVTPFAPPGVMTATIVPFSPFFRVLVGSTTGPGGTDERTNFANWFTYYRIRMLMMKSGLGRAFVSIGNNYRVGFMTIYADPSSDSLPSYLPIADFNQGTGTATSCTSPQKCAWFNAVYTQTPGGGTPLKVALSTAARNIAGKVGPDPQQYSCQQNFILLSTDGYWNSGTPNGVKLNGSTAIGNQDSNSATAPRPQYDGGLSGSTNTLADVAWYYYNTDLRPSTGTCNTGVAGADVCQDNVPVAGIDTAPWQHVTLFTLGLGTNGQLVYASDYLTGGSADYNAIAAGTSNANWPTPVGDTLTTIDDLWHAAVNGHGQYFSAKNPQDLVNGLTTALAGVSARVAAGAAAATSNLEPVAGDNFAFVASYTTKEWTGDLQSRTIDLTTGSISSTPNWSAQTNLDLVTTDVSDTRRIFTNLGTLASPVLTDFLPGSFTSTQKSNWFTPVNAPQLSQYAGWTAAQQTAGTADTVINYLRGQWGFEERSINNANQLYRFRAHVLGDIIDGKPVYMRLPPFNYAENNYAAFKVSSTVTSRTGTVFVGANDGMLHAFDAATGNEIWAYIPSFVLPNLKSLADDTYSGNHKYFVDGSPVVTDIWNGSAWKTILVGGLGAGGKGYFALDVTDPTNPSILWEYSDANLGYSFGNPVIGKLADGTWIVAFTSGYNNVGDGVGRLYVLDAWTGTFKFNVTTNTGSATSPSGLNKIAAWVDNGLLDNTIQRIYGGDQFGNLWRFDINNQYPPAGIDAVALANFQVGTYQQPITTQPELGLVNGTPMIYVGTGRYLGASDLSDLNQQSLYAIADKLTGTGIGDARTESTCPLVQQSLTVIDVNHRSTSTLPVDLTTKCGWFLDFNPTGGNTPGERVNVDPKLQLGVLAVATNIPLNDVCSVGGTSFLYFFDYRTGSFVSTSTNNIAGSRIGNAIAVGVNTYQLPSGQVVSTVTTSDDQHPTFGNPSNPSAVLTGRRVMWRELLN